MRRQGQRPATAPQDEVVETLLVDVPHRQVVLTIPKTLRIFFKYRRRLLGELSRAARSPDLNFLILVPGGIFSFYERTGCF
jgi:hypothetical protein